ncbi:MAG: site-specific DNA-methyltransferase [Firmicutes bacterium]|nr:site-specific DNA-methyltransferase [Bacillota bacterium]
MGEELEFIDKIKKGKNAVICADNLELMRSLEDAGFSGCLDFIYIDPPFFTNKDFPDYRDRWPSGIDAFLDMMRPRLTAMRGLLSDTGLIAVHMDWHAVHYVKVMMDEIFGMNRFVNEIIWSYRSGGASTKRFARKHDTILLYSKGPAYYFSAQKERSYNRGNRPYCFKDVEEFEDEEGKWYTLVNRRDVLAVDMVGRTSSERTGYSTQKPEALLRILLNSCCPEGGLCADFFAGSGTLGAAAAESGRRFLLCDSNPEAVELCLQRLGLYL